MHKVRVIPVLLLKNWGIEKSINFKKHVYIGSPINAVRIFNGHNVDELILLDIAATPAQRGPDPQVVAQIVSEARMPLTIGGGIRDIETIRRLMDAGVDRVSLNTHAIADPILIEKAADVFGSQCVVVAIDVGKDWRGRHRVYTRCGTKDTGLSPVDWAKQAQERGAGEILLTSITQDGSMSGYDVELVREVADAVDIPVIACGGAGNVAHLAEAVDEGHASAVAAGAFFLFFGPRRTVLITYPSDEALISALGSERVRPKDPFAQPPARGIGA